MLYRNPHLSIAILELFSYLHILARGPGQQTALKPLFMHTSLGLTIENSEAFSLRGVYSSMFD